MINASLLICVKNPFIVSSVSLPPTASRSPPFKGGFPLRAASPPGGQPSLDREGVAVGDGWDDLAARGRLFFSALSPAPPVFPRESLPAYRFPHFSRAYFVDQPHMCYLPNPALVPSSSLPTCTCLTSPHRIRGAPRTSGGSLLPLESFVPSTFSSISPTCASKRTRAGFPPGKLARRA